MLVDLKQNEIDIAEEDFMKSIFGTTTIDSKTEWLLKFLDIDINKTIQNFENFVKPMLKDDGRVDGVLLNKLIASKFPKLSQMLPKDDFRLVEASSAISEVLKGIWK